MEIDSESVESNSSEADLVELIGDDDPRFEAIKDEPVTINRIESSNSTTEPRLIITSEEK